MNVFPFSRVIRFACAVVMGGFLCAFSLAAQGAFSIEHSASVTNYTPGGTVDITVKLHYGGASPDGVVFQLFIPDGWGEGVDGVTLVSGTSPNFPSGLQFVPSVSPNRIDAGWATAFGGIPADGEAIVIRVSVPADEDQDAEVTVQGAPSGQATKTPSDDNPVVIHPPAPPVFTNPSPVTGQTDVGTPANITNTVVAGQSMQFKVTISASAGQALTGTAFAVGPAIWDQGQSKWDLDWDHPENWFTYAPARDFSGLPPGYVDFSGSGTFSRTVGGFTHNFTFTPIAGSQDGERVLTWHVPAGLVTKATPQNDRVFVVSSGGIQDNGGSDDFLWAVRVDPVDAVPVITEGDTTTLSVDEDSSGTVNLNATDADPGDTLTWSVTDTPDHGTVTFVIPDRDAPAANTGNSVFVAYTPVTNYFGSDSFAVTVDDGDGGTDVITVNVTVNPTNDPPEANDFSPPANLEEDSINNLVDVLANDSAGVDYNENRDNYTISKVNGGAIVLDGAAVSTTHGSVLLKRENVGGNVTRQVLRYTPVADYFGQDSFTYTIADGNGGTDTATVTLNVVNVNDPPVANNDAATVDEDSVNNPIDVLANDSILPDVGETLIVFDITQPSHGTVNIGNGSANVLYTPAGDYFGADSFTYTVSDGHGGTAIGTVDITVTNVNDPPVAQNVDVFIRKVTGQQPAPAEITLRATDIDNAGSELTFALQSAPGRGTLGSVTNNGDGTATVTYTVTDANTAFYNGNPDGPQADTFTYIADDGVEGSRAQSKVAATVTITYRENQPPAVTAFSVDNTPGTIVGDPTLPQTGPEGVELEEGDTLPFAVTFSDATDPSPAGGEMTSIQWYVDNVLQTPGRAGGSELTDSFTFVTTYDTIANDPTGHRPPAKVFAIKAVGTDNQGGTNEVVWNVTVHDVDRDAPAPTIHITPATPKTTDALSAEVDAQPADPDGDAIVSYQVIWNSEARASWEMNPLTPDKTLKGDQWTVAVTPQTNPYGAETPITSPHTVSANVTIGNTDPIATAQAENVNEDTQTAFSVSGVDPDVDDGVDTLTFAVGTEPEHAAIFTLGTDGSVVYKPAANFFGTDTFTFTVSDAGGETRAVSAPATVTITVAPQNDPPVPQNVAANVRLQDAANSVSVALVLNATDVDGVGLIDYFTIKTLPDAGKGVLKLQDGTVLNVGDQIAANNDQATVVFYPAFGGAGNPPVTGATEFTYSATDTGLPAPGIESTLDATVTIGIGTPPWFPVISWSDPNPTGATQYNVQIWPQAAERVQQASVVQVSVTGKTLLLPIDYINGGSHGLAPGDYGYSVQAHSGFDPVPVDLVTNGTLTVDDYGVATADSVVDSGRAGSVSALGNGLYAFTFNVANSSGYLLEVYDNSDATGTPVATQEEFFGIDPDTGLVEFVGPFTRTLELPNPLRGMLYWRVRGFNPNVTSTDPDGELSTDGKKLYGLWSDTLLPGFTVDAGSVCTDTPVAPTLVREPDQTAGEDDTLAVELNWNAVACATAYYVNVRNFDTGARTFSGFSGTDANGAPALSKRLTLGPGRYVWTVAAFNANATAAKYGHYAPLDDFRIIPNAVEGQPSVVGNLLPPVIDSNGALQGSEVRPIFQLRANNADAFDIRIFDYTRRRWMLFRAVPNVRNSDGQQGLGAGTQTIFIGTRIRNNRRYKYQARARNTQTGEIGPWSRYRFFRGGE